MAYNIWPDVLARGFQDAVSATAACRDNGTVREIDVFRARLWLLTDKKDFYEVCELANIDADGVRKFAQALALTNWKGSWPKSGMLSDPNTKRTRRMFNEHGQRIRLREDDMYTIHQ